MGPSAWVDMAVERTDGQERSDTTPQTDPSCAACVDLTAGCSDPGEESCYLLIAIVIINDHVIASIYSKG